MAMHASSSRPMRCACGSPETAVSYSSNFSGLTPTTTEAQRKSKWYSIDIVLGLITGTRRRSSLLDETYATFLRDHLTEIEDRFAAASGEWE
ncbi:MAG: hypothetical protein ACJ73S_03905 [Mycobacteriales bacterium]